MDDLLEWWVGKVLFSVLVAEGVDDGVASLLGVTEGVEVEYFLVLQLWVMRESLVAVLLLLGVVWVFVFIVVILRVVGVGYGYLIVCGDRSSHVVIGFLCYWAVCG